MSCSGVGGWPEITEVRHQTNPDTGYSDLEGNCLKNETLPSLAFGMKSCSIKWKVGPQDQLLMGAKSGPNARPPHPLWVETQARGERIVKLIGYDCGKADLRRSRNLKEQDENFDYVDPAAAHRLGAQGLRSRHHADARS